MVVLDVTECGIKVVGLSVVREKLAEAAKIFVTRSLQHADLCNPIEKQLPAFAREHQIAGCKWQQRESAILPFMPTTDAQLNVRMAWKHGAMMRGDGVMRHRCHSECKEKEHLALPSERCPPRLASRWSRIVAGVQAGCLSGCRGTFLPRF